MDKRDWTRLGATIRLEQINAERLSILAVFPELRSGGHYRRTRTISPEGRKAMSDGMRRLWARRRAAAKRTHNMSDENRRKAAERMRAYWAKKRGERK